MQNSNIQIALIGAGGMGQGDARMATTMPGVKLVAACDLYDGRLARCRETWGDGIFTTRDYREILNRKDIDAVIVATPDHWHSRITIDAMNAGKDVYCEKPMVQKIEEGKQVIEAQKKTGRVLQIGSQYASSVVFLKAAELIKQGAIGELNMVQAHLDRNSALGAWQYSIPPDASPQTVDWDRFLGHAPKRPFEAVRFFRWRNYGDYGTGVAGDLYVHLLTGLHVATGAVGPSRIYAQGGTRFWKDGRDAPDVMLAAMDYPTFTLALRVNFASGGEVESFGLKFIGSEGTLTIGYDTVTLAKRPRQPEYDYTISGFPQRMHGQMAAEFNKIASKPVTAESLTPDSEAVFRAPRWFSAHREHHRAFYNAVRSRKPHFEDAVFGFRTAGPSLLTGTSMEEGRICTWDAEKMIAG